MVITRTSLPTSTDIIPLTDAKTHLRVTHSDDDAYITLLIAAAREWVENYCKCWLGDTAGKVKLDAWPDSPYLHIPLHPLVSVESIKYFNEANSEITMTLTTDYRVDTDSVPPRVYFENTYSTNDGPNVIVINFTAGFVEDEVPESMIYAMKILIADMYENRQSSVIGTITSPSRSVATVQSLLSSFVLIMPN